MMLRGIVTSKESSGTRVTLIDKDNTVSSPLQVASHVGDLNIGDNVVVALFSGNMSDGIIIAKF